MKTGELLHPRDVDGAALQGSGEDQLQHLAALWVAAAGCYLVQAHGLGVVGRYAVAAVVALGLRVPICSAVAG